MKHTGDYELDEINMLEQECADLEEENNRLKEENKELKEKLSEVTMVADDEKQSIEHILELEKENEKLKAENRKLKETIKDHQLYEEKLEHRIIEFEELLHGE